MKIKLRIISSVIWSRKLVVILLTIGLLMIPTLAITSSGDTYYVDSANGDDNNNGLTSETAWKTVSKVQNWDLRPGNTILFKKGGNWDETLQLYSISGTSNNPIIFESYGQGNNPIINGVVLNGNSYLTIKDTTFDSAGVALANTNNVTLDNLTIYDANNGFGGVYIGSIVAGQGNNNIVKNSEIYDTSNAGGSGHGIYILSQNGYCKNNIISKNIIHDNKGTGIELLGSANDSNEISENTIYQNDESGIHVGMASKTTIEDNLVYQNCQNLDDCFGIDLIGVGNDNVVRYNTVHDQHDTANDSSVPTRSYSTSKYGSGGIRFDGDYNGDLVTFTNSSGNIANYNLIYSEYQGMQVINFHNTKVYNNIIYNSAKYGIIIQAQIGSSASSNKIKNNIIHTAGDYLIYNFSATNNEINYNVYFSNNSQNFSWNKNPWEGGVDFSQWQTDSNQDSNSFFADPLFVSAGAKNFKLQSSSLAVNSGSNVGLSRDFEGNSVPQGTNPDIGAYESSYTGPVCGNNICESNETCSNCNTDCGSCCGNGIIDSDEQCDDLNFDNKTCESLGFEDGDLNCNSCLLDTSSCNEIESDPDPVDPDPVDPDPVDPDPVDTNLDPRPY